jgi:hypothetical protein
VGALPNRLNIRDTRGPRAYLQVTRHRDQRTVVVSQWRDDICVASTPLDVSELPALIGVLAEALGDAVTASPRHEGGADRSLWLRIRRHFRPTLARIVELPHRRVGTDPPGAATADRGAPNDPGMDMRD